MAKAKSSNMLERLELMAAALEEVVLHHRELVKEMREHPEDEVEVPNVEGD